MEDLTTETTVDETESFTQDLAKRFLLGAATTLGSVAAGFAVSHVKTKLAERKIRKAESPEITEE